MPVSGAFRSRREGKRRLRTFCGFPGRCRPAAMGGLREGLGRLGYRSVTHPESHASGRAGLGRDAGRDAVLQRLRRAGLISATFVRSGSAGLPRATRSATSSSAPACSRWSSNGIWTAAQSVWPIHACGIHGPGTATCCALIDSAGRRRPTALLCTNFGCPIRGRTGQLAVLAGPGKRVPDDAVPPGKALHARQAGSRLPLAAKDGRSQISGDLRAQRKAQGTSAAAFVPDAPGRIGVPSP